MGCRRIYAPWIEGRWRWRMVWVDVGRQKAQAQYRGLERGKRVTDWFWWQRPFLKRTESGQKRAIWVTAETCDLLEVAGMLTLNGWNCRWNGSLYLSHGTTFPPEIGEGSLGQGLLLMGCLSQKSFWNRRGTNHFASCTLGPSRCLSASPTSFYSALWPFFSGQMQMDS